MRERSLPSTDRLAKLGLRRVINVSGTMTVIGASSALPEVVEAVADILPRFVEISALQRAASATIARLCDAEAGFVTASTAAAITLAVAGAMTGLDRAAIARLPDSSGLRNQVVILAGHLISYGAPVGQAIRLAGAQIAAVGQATSAAEYELDGALSAETAAALYVVSHHAAQTGMIPLPRFAEIAHAKGVPVIVDAAAEYDLRKFLREGADLALYSAHKFLRAPTAGIVAGRRDLVRAAYLQNGGIGRGMKVGKEGIAGTIVALEAWEKTDHAARRRDEKWRLDAWLARPRRSPGRRRRDRPRSDRQSGRAAAASASGRKSAYNRLGSRRHPRRGEPVRRRARRGARARLLRARSLQSRCRGSPDRGRSPRRRRWSRPSPEGLSSRRSPHGEPGRKARSGTSEEQRTELERAARGGAQGRRLVRTEEHTMRYPSR